MTPREIAAKHLNKYIRDYGDEDDKLDWHVQNACAEAFKAGLLRAAEIAEDIDHFQLAEAIRAEAEKETT